MYPGIIAYWFILVNARLQKSCHCKHWGTYLLESRANVELLLTHFDTEQMLKYKMQAIHVFSAIHSSWIFPSSCLHGEILSLHSIELWAHIFWEFSQRGTFFCKSMYINPSSLWMDWCWLAFAGKYDLSFYGIIYLVHIIDWNFYSLSSYQNQVAFLPCSLHFSRCLAYIELQVFSLHCLLDRLSKHMKYISKLMLLVYKNFFSSTELILLWTNALLRTVFYCNWMVLWL